MSAALAVGLELGVVVSLALSIFNLLILLPYIVYKFYSSNDRRKR